MLRRTALLSTAAFLAAPAIGRAQTSAPAVKLGVIPIEPSAEAFYATDMGFFKKRNLNVELQTFTNGATIAAGVAGGSIDIGFCDVVTIASAHSKGVPLVYIAPGILNTYKAPTFGIICKQEIQSAKDMNGKTFAVNAINNISHIPVLAWIDNNGGDSKSMKWLEIPLPAIPDAILAGRIDGGVEGEPFVTFGGDKGLRVILMDKNGIAPSFMLSGWFATRAWLEKNADTAKQFTAAIRETAEWTNKNPKLAAPILSKYSKTPEAVVDRMHRGQFSEVLTVAEVQPIIDSAAKYGVLKAFPATDFFWSQSPRA